MKESVFSIPYSVAEYLPSKERFVYYELCRLAATHDNFNEEFNMKVARGSLIISNLRLSRIIDYSYTMTAMTIDRLVEKNLIEVKPIDLGVEFNSFYLIQIKEVLSTSIPLMNRIKQRYLQS